MRQPLTPLQKDMLDVLRDLARQGKECPSDNALTRRMGAESRATDLMMSLERKGYIEVDRFGYKRVIRLTDTGESTALPDGAEINGVRLRMGGDPCWHCGAKPDAEPAFKCRRCR